MRVPGSGLLTGMWVTLRNFRAPKVTRQYPEERPQMPDRWRGRLDLIYDPFGEHAIGPAWWGATRGTGS